MSDQYYRKAKEKLSLARLAKNLANNKRVLFSILIGVPMCAFILFSNRGVLKRMSLESEKAVMEEKIRHAMEDQQRLQQLSRGLDKDPKAIEKVAREKYGMIRPGETVYKVRKEKQQ